MGKPKLMVSQGSHRAPSAGEIAALGRNDRRRQGLSCRRNPDTDEKLSAGLVGAAKRRARAGRTVGENAGLTDGLGRAGIEISVVAAVFATREAHGQPAAGFGSPLASMRLSGPNIVLTQL